MAGGNRGGGHEAQHGRDAATGGAGRRSQLAILGEALGNVEPAPERPAPSGSSFDEQLAAMLAQMVQENARASAAYGAPNVGRR